MLTAKQDKFAQGIAKGLSQREAYRAAFDCPTSSDKTIDQNASKLAQREDIQARVEQIRRPVVAKVRYELEQAMVECDEAIALAKQEGQPGAMVSAVQLKAKLNGLLVEDRKNRRTPLDDLSDDQLDTFIHRKANEAGVTLQ